MCGEFSLPIVLLLIERKDAVVLMEGMYSSLFLLFGIIHCSQCCYFFVVVIIIITSVLSLYIYIHMCVCIYM